VASAPNASSTFPSKWTDEPARGSGWHSAQASARESGPATTCREWAPTDMAELSRSPWSDSGGAPVWFSPPPWHPVHALASERSLAGWRAWLHASSAAIERVMT
jgi:hypothetical protein